MKPTHKSRSGAQDRVYHLDEVTGEVCVKIRDEPWKISAWTREKLFYKVMVKINTFKGNK